MSVETPESLRRGNLPPVLHRRGNYVWHEKRDPEGDAPSPGHVWNSLMGRWVNTDTGRPYDGPDEQTYDPNQNVDPSTGNPRIGDGGGDTFGSMGVTPPEDGGGGGGGGGDDAVSNVARVYQGATESPASSQMAEFLAYLREQQASQQQERARMRDILMSQLDRASQPVSINDAGLKPVIDARRLALQRSAERQRSQLSARAASENLLDSGYFETGVQGIEQGRGEAEAGFTGDILYQELNNRRSQLQQLLNLAMSVGDAEAARNISAQLQAIGAQMNDQYRYTALGEGARQFDQGLGFNYDQLGADIGFRTAGLNQAALLALLNAGI